jgi:hypothetical protein
VCFINFNFYGLFDGESQRAVGASCITILFIQFYYIYEKEDIGGRVISKSRTATPWWAARILTKLTDDEMPIGYIE